MTIEAIAPIIIAIISAIVAFKSRREIRASIDKAEADAKESNSKAAQAITNAAISMIDPYKKQLAQMSSDVAEFKHQIGELADEIENLKRELIWWKDVAHKLYYQIKSYGHVPLCKLEIPNGVLDSDSRE
jgi:predicted RNase H-like nuclease (RuvC/YqgF family)